MEKVWHLFILWGKSTKSYDRLHPEGKAVENGNKKMREKKTFLNRHVLSSEGHSLSLSRQMITLIKKVKVTFSFSFPFFFFYLFGSFTDTFSSLSENNLHFYIQ